MTAVEYKTITGISIHVPAQGATMNPSDVAAKSIFQFTLPHRERHKPVFTRKRGEAISIHAPAQGATLSYVPYFAIGYNFNSRSRTGSDRLTRIPTAIAAISIHAPAQGATLSGCESTPRQLFQFTLPHRERPSPLRNHCSFTLFQFTLPHRERLRSVRQPYLLQYFNSRSRTGSDSL